MKENDNVNDIDIEKLTDKLEKMTTSFCIDRKLYNTFKMCLLKDNKFKSSNDFIVTCMLSYIKEVLDKDEQENE